MTTRNSVLPYVFVALSGLSLVSIPASARDREFGLLVRHVESYYHARRAHRFVLGFASVVVNIAHPYGVKNFKLAIFENQDLSASRDDLDFASVVQAGLNEGWQPLVQVYSRRAAERTCIFARTLGQDVKLLVATLEKDEAVVLEVKLNPEKLDQCLDKWLEKPYTRGKSATREVLEQDSE